MPQTKYGYDFYRDHLIPATVTLKRDLAIISTETACVKKVNYQREKRLIAYETMEYHALIDEAERTVRLFVPIDGFIEEVSIPLRYVKSRIDRTEQPIDYRKWGNTRKVSYSITEMS
jgi:hypothetical protein